MEKLQENIDLRNHTNRESQYPFFFENSTVVRDFEFDMWPTMVYKNQSLIAHSGVFDHINHGVFRNNGDPKRLQEHSLLIAEDFRRLRSMIDNNPEYLLILSSDHGVDENTASGYGKCLNCSLL
jgi:hypothetical protein